MEIRIEEGKIRGAKDIEPIEETEFKQMTKYICKIDGRLVTVSELKEFMNSVIEIHGQNENQSLLEVSNHIKLLDKFSGEKLNNLKEEYKEYYFQYLEINKKIKENFGEEKEKQRILDLLKYQLNEIDSAELKIGEEEELYEKRKIVMNSEKIANSIGKTKQILDANIIDNLSECIRQIDFISDYNDEYKKVSEVIRNSFYDLEEIKNTLSLLEEDIEFDSEEQNKLEQRLDIIQDLKRKYGNSIEEILNFRNSIEIEIEKIENNEDYIKKLQNELKEIEEKMKSLSQKISEIRKENAKIISEKINLELKDLEMNRSDFEVRIEEENKFNSNGTDKVEFLISTNLGTDKKSLIKIASGGEMSRIMLAIKNVLADVDDIPIMVFDEIDTGISGNAGVVTGEKIKNISKNHQVICITHLASIAAKGDYNYYIYKESDEISTKTKIKQLDEKETLNEIARISSGVITAISLNLAKQLRGNLKIA